MTTDAVTEILQRLSRIEAQLGERCSVRGAEIAGIERSLKRQGERIGRLESTDERRRGAAVMLAAIAGSVGAAGGSLVNWLMRQ